MRHIVGVLLACAALLLVVAAACGGTDTESIWPQDEPASAQTESVGDAMTEPTAAPPAPTVAPAAQESDGGGGAKVQLALLPQNRIIVHNARMSLVVRDVADTVDSVADAARDLGGWVVGSDRSSKHSGSIAIRVPAGALEEAFRRLEALALRVDSRAVTSDDVTDEYVDSQSRLASLRATEERLLSFWTGL